MKENIYFKLKKKKLETYENAVKQEGNDVLHLDYEAKISLLLHKSR